MYVCPLCFYFLGPKILSLIFSHLTHSREKELELVLASSMDAVLEQAMLSGVCVPDPEDIVRISSSSNQFPSRGMYVCMYVCVYFEESHCKRRNFKIYALYVCICMYICMYICMFIYMYVCTYADLRWEEFSRWYLGEELTQKIPGKGIPTLARVG